MEIQTQQKIDSFLRVNHAGESAAVRLYQGQLAVLAKCPSGKDLNHMKDQEEKHRSLFSEALKKQNTSESILNPLWHHLSYGLGVCTALMGTRTAMDCTIAVEDIIEGHYKKQLDTFPDTGKAEIKTLIAACYADEVSHKNVATEYSQQHTPESPKLFKAIQIGCRAAIWLSERI